MKNAPFTEAQVQSAIDGKLVNYSSTAQMNSAIEQKASEITQSVSETYQTEAQVQSAIGEKLSDYPTTSQMKSSIEQKAKSLKLSVERSGYFSVFEGTSWTNYTDGTFGNKITVNGVSGIAARLSTTDPDTLTYARGNTLHGSLSYRILTAIKGTSSSASFRFFLGVKYTDDTYTIHDIIYDQGKQSSGAFAFSKIEKGGGYIYVPSALVDAYKAATNWSTYANQIRAIEDYPDICGQ